MISPNEWHRANVFTSPITDSRISKLSALCGIEMAGTLEPVSQQTQQEPDIDISMLG